MKYNPLMKTAALIAVALLSVALGCGCGKNNEDGATKIVLMTGFDKDEIFRIEDISCSKPELMVYLTNTQNQYENVYGREIWNTNFEGVTLEDNIKDTVLAKIAQIKTMNLLAEEYNIQLTPQEEKCADEAANAYFTSLKPEEAELMGVSEEIIYNMYVEYARAEKVYEYLIKDINPEISDDEARTITVEHILIKTYAKDGTGKKIAYTQEAREEAYNRAVAVLNMARDTENYSFEELIQEYNEDNVSTYSFGKGEMDAAFEETAFNLDTGEISDIVESEYGYHIIKCINSFNRDETDANKLKIVENRKKEVFEEKYDDFVNTLTRRLNEDLWETVGFIESENVITTTFFDVYMEYFD